VARYCGPVPEALILGGTGAIGTAVASRLVKDGWKVTVTGRDAAHLDPPLLELGVRFQAVERSDRKAIAAVVGRGVDLLLDCVCFTAADSETLLPLLPLVNSPVMISSKAVYMDAQGRHSNSDEPAGFSGPIREDHPTLPPGGPWAKDTGEGYGRHKVAAERILLECGAPVSVLRASKVHGRRARPPREWVFLKRALDRRPCVVLARHGRGVDHPSSAANLASLVQLVADKPGLRVLNAADPDSPEALEISRVVAAHLGHRWEEVLLPDDAPPELGDHPWNRRFPIFLDTSAAELLGYRPVGDYAATVAEELDWLTDLARSDPDPLESQRSYFSRYFDYEAEDRFLRHRPL
jgi:nucleoside-diphosphate-sugar epimerase